MRRLTPVCRRRSRLLALLAVVAGAGAWSVSRDAVAQGPARRPAAATQPTAPPAAAGADAAAAVAAASRAYKEALDRGDAEAVKGMWTADGDIIDDMGNVTLGRSAAEGLAPAAEGDARPAFHIDDLSVRVVDEDVAIEDGTVTVTPPGSSVAHHGRFCATWVRGDDGWKLASLREWRTDPSETASTLEALGWLEGDWAVEVHGARDDGKPAPTVEMSVRWNPARTFLLRETRLTLPGGGPSKVLTQRIGWDPLTRQIRSWSFDDEGGRSEAAWTLENGTWVARTMSVLPDGRLTRTINHYVFDGVDGCTFQSLPASPDDEHAAPTTMTMTRKPGRPTE